MKNNTIVQGLFVLLGVFLIWFGFSRLDYLSLFNIESKRVGLEQNLGELIWKQIQRTEDVITNDSLVKTLDSLLLPICEANDINRDSLKVHLIAKDEINAFALPNNHLVVYTGLIIDCKKQEALQGVLGHEIAHITNKHVMKKLSKEIGFSVLLSATAGSGGGQIAREVLKSLSSSAYDRTLEKEADLSSVDYLIKAKIDPKPFADFMYEIALQQDMPDLFMWIASHPDSEERAKYIVDYLKGKKIQSQQTLSAQKWTEFQKKLKSY